MATMKDIAKKAGVSHGTVSNVLNKTGKVSTEKIMLVEAAARELGYVPNTQAQRLRQQSVDGIAIILPNLKDCGYLQLFSAIQRRLFDSGIEVKVYLTSDIPGQEERILEQISSSALGAVVTVPCLREDLYSLYESLPCPVMFVNRKPERDKKNFSYISFDFFKIGRDVAEYVQRKSWRCIGLFSSPSFFRDCSQLYEGLRSVLKGKPTTLRWYTSDSSLMINKAFELLENDDLDFVLTTDPARADALETALNISGKRKPEILTLNSYQVFTNYQTPSYQLNYYHMAEQITISLKDFLQDNIPIKKEIVLEGTGIPFIHIASPITNKRTLTILALSSPTTTALQQISPLLERETGISLRITEMQYDDLYAQVSMLNEKFSYDLIRLDVAWLNKINTETFLSLEELQMTQEHIPHELIDSACRHYTAPNGIRCTLPFDPSVQILLYRTDLFQNATLKRTFYEQFHKQLNIPKTLEEYEQVAQFFTASHNPNSPTQYGTAITCGTAAAAACDFLPFFLARKTQKPDGNNNLSFIDKDMELALGQYSEIAQHYSGEGNWWRDTANLFSEGKLAMASIFSNHTSYIMNCKHSNVVGKVGASIIPGSQPLLGGGVIGVSRFSQKLNDCRDFFRWYYSPEITSAIVRLGGTSPLKSAYENYENVSIFPWLTVARDSFSIGTRGFQREGGKAVSIRDYEYILGTAVKNVVNRSLTPEEALNVAEHMYQSLSRT